MRITGSRSAAIAALVVGASSFLAPASSARIGQAATLPPVTLSSTDLHVGDEISVSGTGCVDPATSSGEGLEITTFRLLPGGRGGSMPSDLATIAVAPDGSYDGVITIGQPLTNGPQQMQVKCGPDGSDPYGETFAATTVDITGTSPSLPDLSGVAGGVIELTLPCDIQGGEYGSFAISLLRSGDPIYLNLSGSVPYADSPVAGDVVQVPVPAETPIGTFDATAECSVSEAGTSAYYSDFKVTIAAAAPGPAPAEATPAVPTTGAASYTG